MLTKWGAALGLASAGRIASGGGGNTGVPLGPFADWAALPVSAQDESLADVLDLGPTNSYGLATYDANAGQWKLLFGYFLTLADLNAFTEPKALTAVAAVGPSLDAPDSVRYQWDDPNVQWLRTPDPVEYIYAATDWANLPTQDTIQADDEAVVASLGLGNAYGRAVYDGTDWLLSRAWFDTVADMTAFPELKSVGALAAVEASASDDENAVRYQWDGSAWARTAALTAGYAWTLSGLRDFSAIGLQDGDFGVFTPSGGQPILLRYKAACTTAYGSPVQAWMTPIAYAGTPVMQAWTDGTESNVTLAAQGWTLVNDAGCTVTATGGFQRLATSALAASARLRCLSGSVTSTTRFECLFQARASTAASDTTAQPVVLGDGTRGTLFGQVGSAGLGFKDFVFGGPQQTPLRNAVAQSLPSLASDPSTCLVRDEGRTVFDSAMVDGLHFADYLRNLQSTSFNGFQVSAQGKVGTAATLDYRGQIITY
jgi:hypothetical protein